MASKKRNRQTLIILMLMLVSLSGVILVQLVWMNRAVAVNRDKFDMEVSKAIRETVDKISRKEEVIFVSKHIDYNTDDKVVTLSAPNDVSKTELVYVSRTEDHAKPAPTESLIIESSGNLIITSPNVEYDTVNISVTTPKINERVEDFAGIIEEMVIEFEAIQRPIEERICKADIDEQLSSSLKRHNITIPYSFSVSTDKDSIISSLSSTAFTPDKNDYSAALFPDYDYEDDYHLNVQFESRNSYIFSSLNGILIASLLFTLALISTFIYTLSVVIRQKKISQIKSDFINNITHEFKTPITTISVAADSLRNEQVKSDPTKQDYYTSVIRKENQKMNQRIEDILQLSLEDKHENAGRFQEANVSKLIQECCDSFKLRTENGSGEITFTNNAANPILICDAEQISTMICNLCDNAIKYSENKPQVEISLEDNKNTLCIKVTDKGIGIARKEQSKIFERFYRVHTGDIHTVKGFGLGLSQVRSIVDMHQGKISVKSDTGKGSTFTIVLPRNPRNHE